MSFEKHIDQEMMVALRRHFHENPELAYNEFETADKIVAELTKIGVDEVIRPTETSVVAVIKGGKAGKVVALRADIDALPITEETPVSYASKKPGAMHACGHDAHTASLIGAAKALVAVKAEIPGTVKLIFQHAEELVPGGAQSIIDTGVLNDVNMFFATHVFIGGPVGVVGSRVGPILAANDVYNITVKGRGGHAASPHNSIDSIVVGSEIVVNLNHIVSRNIDPLSNVVVTCGRFLAGNVVNIIPDTAQLGLSVRTNTHEEREYVGQRIREVVEGICKAHGADFELEHKPGYAATINDAKAVDIAKRTAEKFSSLIKYEETPMRMGSEDFSAYSKIAPAAMLGIMGGGPEQGYEYYGHHPKYDLDEGCLKIAAIMYVGCALEALATL